MCYSPSWLINATLTFCCCCWLIFGLGILCWCWCLCGLLCWRVVLLLGLSLSYFHLYFHGHASCARELIRIIRDKQRSIQLHSAIFIASQVTML